MASDKERFLLKRIQSLEWELDIEKRKNIEAHRAMCKKERILKEITLKSEQEKQSFKDLKVYIEDLESALKIHKNKIRDVETISNYNADRFRKVHKMYVSESGRSEEAQDELRRLKASGRTNLFVQA